MKIALPLMVALAICMAAPASAEAYRIAEGNEALFENLLVDLLAAHETPSGDDAQRIETDLAAIGEVSDTDGEIARAIARHWQDAYLNADDPLYIHDGSVRATALEKAGIPQEYVQGIAVLGYELKDGEMTGELKARCEAAAAAARSFPGAILVCSGGATGKNNPEGHTEAARMRDYLVETCGIDAGRIRTDEQAMTTVDNAVNTFAILEAEGVGTMILVTSAYHQKRGRLIYNAVGALHEQVHGHRPRIAGNYCVDVEPSRPSLRDDDAKIAIHQLAEILGLSRGDGGGRTPERKPAAP